MKLILSIKNFNHFQENINGFEGGLVVGCGMEGCNRKHFILLLDLDLNILYLVYYWVPHCRCKVEEKTSAAGPSGPRALSLTTDVAWFLVFDVQRISVSG